VRRGKRLGPAPAYALALAVGLGLALLGCRTDVSTALGFGTQGYVVTWLAQDVVIRGIEPGQNEVFFASAAGIQSCPRQGCTGLPTSVYVTGGGPSTGGGSISRIVGDDTRLYWTEIVAGTPPGGRVMTCEQSDCTTTATALYQSLGVTLNPGGTTDPGFLAVDGGQAYWTASRESPNGTLIDLFSVPADPAVPNPSVSSYAIPAEFSPIVVYDGTVYGALATQYGAALASCPAAAALAGGCASQIVLADETQYQLLSVAVFGGTVYFDAVVPQTHLAGLYACTTPTCDAPQLVARPLWHIVAIDGDRVYGGTGTPEGNAAFGTCVIGACTQGLEALDLPFSFVQLPGIPPNMVPDVVLDPQGGAYAFGQYVTPPDNVGFGKPLNGIVHLSPP